MRQRRRSTIRELRLTIDCLPRSTRAAMLEGIRGNEIIVGAYSDGSGVCPMLAAHRAGGRTSLIAFARAWDRFASRGKRGRGARRATERELLVLTSHLEASLLADDAPTSELAAAMSEHRQLLAERSRGPEKPSEAPRQRPGDPDRSSELRRRGGWSWLRVVRSYDEYEQALSQLDRAGARSPADEQRQPDLVTPSR
jgi:hypothetical protein